MKDFSTISSKLASPANASRNHLKVSVSVCRKSFPVAHKVSNVGNFVYYGKTRVQITIGLK